MQWAVTTPPATTPIIADSVLMRHIGLDCDLANDSTEQAYLAELLAAAVEYAETAMQASLITRTITATFYQHADEARELLSLHHRHLPFELPRGPVTQLVSITNADSTPITGATLKREGNTDLLIMPANWQAPVSVVYTAGYGPASTDVPADIRQAIRTHIATLYDNQYSAQDKTLVPVPHSLEAFYKLKSRGSVIA